MRFCPFSQTCTVHGLSRIIRGPGGGKHTFITPTRGNSGVRWPCWTAAPAKGGGAANSQRSGREAARPRPLAQWPRPSPNGPAPSPIVTCWRQKVRSWDRLPRRSGPGTGQHYTILRSRPPGPLTPPHSAAFVDRGKCELSRRS